MTATTHATQTPSATIVGPDDVTTIQPFGNPVKITLRAENTGGQYALMEFNLVAGQQAPPAHSHTTFDELYQVLDGALTIHIDGEERRVVAGSSVLIPRGTVHTFSNPDNTPAHFFYLVSPAGFERYFEDFAERSASRGGQLLPEDFQEIPARYDIVLARP